MRKTYGNLRKGLDKTSQKDYTNIKCILRQVKIPLLQHCNTVLFQCQEFCSEKFLQNRTKADQDNFKTGRLEGWNNCRF